MRRWRLAVGVIGLAAVLAAGCGSDDDPAAPTADRSEEASTGSGGPSTDDDYYSGGSDGTSTTSTTAGARSTVATVSVATDAELGPLLVGPDGRTLYLFEQDSGTRSACTGACLTTWPPLRATGTPTAGAGVDAGKLSMANGQVTYGGHLLYYFAGDRAPGDVNGIDIADWFAVSPAGDKIPPG